jgi:transglutaminase-like putative cysteine protease
MSMEKKRPQLNLTELHQLKWILGGLLAVLSAWNVIYMDVDAWVWLILITVTTPVAMRWPVLTLHVPRWVHRLAFPLIVALLAADFYFKREALSALIRLAMMLVFYRAVTPRKRRDDLQLIVLGLFLVVVAGVLSVSLAFAVQIVVFTGCALLFLLVINLIDSAETGQPAAEYSAAEPPAWMSIEIGRLARRLHEATDWRVAVLGGGLFGGVVALSAAVFFALPRFDIGNSFFLDNLITSQSKTGFSENVRFGDVTDIQQDTSVALRVEVSDPRAIPGELYWRMLVLDTYEDGLFSVSTALGEQMRQQRHKTARVDGTARPRAGDAVWTFYLEGGTTRYLPLLGSFNQVQFNGGPQDYAINDELRMLRLELTPPKMFAYRVEGMRFGPTLGAPEVVRVREEMPYPSESPGDRTTRERTKAPMPDFLALSLGEADQGKVVAMAQGLGVPPGDAAAFARVAVEWLGSRHRYSLRMNLGPGEGDPLVRWMESGAPGHCELFAGAFTLLARAAGYPARMVTGFRGGTWNEGSGHLSVRNSDAHAWCEIYDAAAKQWVRVDPTPGGSIPGQTPAQESSEAVLARMADKGWDSRLDGVRMFWYRRIVDFDQSSQKELAREAKSAIETYAKALKATLKEKLQAVEDWLRQPWGVGRLAGWVLTVVAVVAAVMGWRVYGRVSWLRLRSGMTRSGTDPVRREAGRWLRKLEAREGKVRAVAGENADTGEGETADVRAELERLRYGPRQSWPNPQGAFRRAKRVCAGRRAK